MARFKFGKKKRDDPNGSMDEESNNSMNQSPKVSEEMAHNNFNGSPQIKPSPVKSQQILSSNDYNEGANVGNGYDTNANIVNEGTPWVKFKLRNSPFPRYRHAASNIASEKNEIFLMGGLKEGSVFGDTWRIHPVLNDEDEIEGYFSENVVISNNNNPPARVGHSSVLIGNAFIIYGGDTVDTDFNGFPDNNFYLFNINNNKYTIPSHILNKPNGRYGHTIGVVSLNNQSSRLYLFGGQLENDVFNDLYYFELNTFKSPKARWELVEPLNNFRPPPLTNHSMSIHKNKIYVFGGVYNNEKVSNDLWCFDIGSSKWNQINTTGNIPLPINEHSACIINDCLYVYGGNDFSGIIYNSLYVLNLHSLVWSKLTTEGEIDGPGARCGHSMTYIPTLNKLVIMGGDKNDYVSDDPNDFNTYETKDSNQNLDTMIYQLDLNSVEGFLSSKSTVIKSTQKALNASLSNANVINSQPVSNSMVGGAVGGIVGGGIVGGAINGINGTKDNLQKEDFQRHARSFSAGPEDFKTPQASPEIKPQEEFVEVPSTAQSEKDLTTEDELDSPVKNFIPQQNGKAMEVDRFNNSATPTFPTREEPKVESIDTAPISKGSSSISRGENEKVKQLITELTTQLNDLKKSTKLEMQNATEKIHQLELENQSLRSNDLQQQITEKDEIIKDLRQQIDPNLLTIKEDDEVNDKSINSSISDLTRFKLERINLNNKLIYLTKENHELNSKLTNFEPFMNNQIGELSKFQKIIKVQEEKITKLTSQVKSEESLRKEVNEWKSKYDNLEIEFENFKAFNGDDEISDDEESLHDITDKSIISNSTTRKSKRDLSNHLENLVQLWSINQNKIGETKEISKNDAVDPMVIELQKQLDQLMKISKEQENASALEINNLKTELNQRLQNLKTFEENYKDALQSVNNTSKALNLTQDELNNQKQLMEKLVKENNELKLFKKASKRVSTRQPLSSQPSVDNFSLSQPIKEEAESDFTNEDEDDDDASNIENAHYNMKIKDLEADLFILKQERDQLKDNMTSLQKQLYLAQNNM
ncbi:kelch repeat-containing protein 1 [[Candida] jaroonii]|uniref:Kelch repeat-containing protein 1 n=1 Tax=[Candida] jaroonii TaxID=467808 RepID=A0ACA9YAN1_9ASCO|nr:kelch repeat-containing protein 1 [[Candida] jaroonii]